MTRTWAAATLAIISARLAAIIVSEFTSGAGAGSMPAEFPGSEPHVPRALALAIQVPSLRAPPQRPRLAAPSGQVVTITGLRLFSRLGCALRRFPAVAAGGPAGLPWLLQLRLLHSAQRALSSAACVSPPSSLARALRHFCSQLRRKCTTAVQLYMYSTTFKNVITISEQIKM